MRGGDDFNLGKAVGDIVFGNLADHMERHRALSPVDKAIARGRYGAGLLVLALYGVLYGGYNAGQLVSTFLRAPAAAPVEVWLPLAIEGGAIMIGCAYLLSGLRGAGSSDHNTGMSIFWSAVRIAAYVAVMWWASAGASRVDWNTWVKPFDLAIVVLLVMDVVGFALHLVGNKSAASIVSRQIEETSIPWQSARRGRR